MNATATKSEIRLMKHYVTNGVVKARCSYSRGAVYVTPGKPETSDCVTIYGKDYAHELELIFGKEAKNDSEYITDYVVDSKVQIFPSHPLWAEACARAERGA